MNKKLTALFAAAALAVPMAAFAWTPTGDVNVIVAYKAGSGVAPNFIQYIAANGYIFSFIVAYIVYVILMRSNAFGTPAQKGFVTKEEDDAMTIVEK